MTMDEFLMYFKMLAVRYPADDDFVRITSNHVSDLSEDKSKAVKKDEIDHTIFLLRQRLLTISNESQEEY